LKNVILLSIDTLRADVLGCYGGKYGVTPFIDSIQNKCIRFTKNQSSGPYTQASFPGILTSSYYLEYRKEEKVNHTLSRKRILISEVLQREGIVTAAFHSNPYLWAYFGWNRGWDKFYDSSEIEVPDDAPYIKAFALNKKVAAWLSSQKERLKDKSIFLWIHYMDVHEPYVPDQKYIDLVDSSINLTRDHMMDLFKDVLLKRDVSNAATVDLLKNLYLAHVREIDEAVKELFEILEYGGIFQDSMVIIASDHGDEFAEHGGLSHDGKMYSELINTPLFLYDASLDKGQECKTLVSNIDISPTIVDIFNLKPVEAFQGQTLLPLESYSDKGVYGDAIDKHKSTEEGATKGVFFFRDKDLKIIYQEKNDSWQLYDLKEDPKEVKNLFDGSKTSIIMMKNLMPRIQKWNAEKKLNR
jgi:arylsulfatase A-like enzyme